MTTKLSDNVDACERVLSWLCDEESREAYQRELIFLYLRVMLPRELVALNKYTMSQEEWAKSHALMHHLREKNLLPKFSTLLPEDHSESELMLTLTFVLNQYAYKDLMTIHKGDIVLDCGGVFWRKFCLGFTKRCSQNIYF